MNNHPAMMTCGDCKEFENGRCAVDSTSVTARTNDRCVYNADLLNEPDAQRAGEIVQAVVVDFNVTRHDILAAIVSLLMGGNTADTINKNKITHSLREGFTLHGLNFYCATVDQTRTKLASAKHRELWNTAENRFKELYPKGIN